MTSKSGSTLSRNISPARASRRGCSWTRTSSPMRARDLAFKAEGVAIRNAQGVPKAWISRRLGGDQIDYADERPEIRAWFSEVLAKHGLKPNMEQAYEAEGKQGQTTF